MGQSLNMLGRRGCLISFGQLSSEAPVVDLRDLMGKGLFVTKFGPASMCDPAEMPQLVARGLALALRRPAMVGDVGGRFPLSRAAYAYEALARGVDGKVLVVPG